MFAAATMGQNETIPSFPTLTDLTQGPISSLLTNGLYNRSPPHILTFSSGLTTHLLLLFCRKLKDPCPSNGALNPEYYMTRNVFGNLLKLMINFSTAMINPKYPSLHCGKYTRLLCEQF